MTDTLESLAAKRAVVALRSAWSSLDYRLNDTPSGDASVREQAQRLGDRFADVAGGQVPAAVTPLLAEMRGHIDAASECLAQLGALLPPEADMGGGELFEAERALKVGLELRGDSREAKYGITGSTYELFDPETGKVVYSTTFYDALKRWLTVRERKHAKAAR